MANSQDFVDDPRNVGVLANVGGELVGASTASVSIFDAGFGLGDGVREGLRLHRSSLLFLGGHLDRLNASARALRIDIGLSAATMSDEIVAASARERDVGLGLQSPDGYPRLQPDDRL